MTGGSASRSELPGRSLTKAYRGRPVVREVDIVIEPGEVVGLLGPNGAGKTTTFYCILGLVTPDRGRVLLDGEDITALPMYQRARRGVSYLPQEASIFRRMTVEDNLLAILETRGGTRALRQERAHDLLREFRVDHLAAERGETLSGGERRRVEIARALVLDPSFILLDEPFAGIDPKARIDIQSIIGELRGRGIGILITDHNVRETLQITDRAYIIVDGEIIKQGSPREIAADSRVRDAYLGEAFELP
jgi:lipopolysaccharide export system ATP-binding protein